MIKAIFWDNDGVLVDTEKLYYRANKEIFLKAGIDLTEELYIENFLIRSIGTWHLAEEKGYGQEEIRRLREERNRRYAELLENEAKVINGVEDTLKFLHGKFIMGVVTSSRKDHFYTIHRKTGLLKYLDFTLTSDDYAEPKPNPEPYLKALELTGIDSTECVAVEDSERGLRAALGAGLKCYVIPTSLTNKCNFTGAEKILKSISDIPGSLFVPKLKE